MYARLWMLMCQVLTFVRLRVILYLLVLKVWWHPQTDLIVVFVCFKWYQCSVNSSFMHKVKIKHTHHDLSYRNESELSVECLRIRVLWRCSSEDGCSKCIYKLFTVRGEEVREAHAHPYAGHTGLFLVTGSLGQVEPVAVLHPFMGVVWTACVGETITNILF